MTDDMTRRAPRAGTVTVEGDQATLVFERHLRHPIDAVWESITASEHLARWYMAEASIEPRAGGRIEFWVGPTRFHFTGRVLVWDPPRVFEHERDIEPRKEVPLGEHSVIRWELAPDGEGTILRLTHRRVARQTAVGVAPATHALLDRLENLLDGEPLVDMQVRMGEVRAFYR